MALSFRRHKFGFRIGRLDCLSHHAWVCQERATKREGKSAAARRVAPKMALGFVASRSQVLGDMLLGRASPTAILGATKHQPFRRHYPRRGVVFWGGQRNAGLDGGLPTVAHAKARLRQAHPSAGRRRRGLARASSGLRLCRIRADIVVPSHGEFIKALCL